MKLGINGLGRIGRAIFRIVAMKADVEAVCINDIDPLLENHSYLLNYDSNYGRSQEKVSVSSGGDCLTLRGSNIFAHSEADINNVPWSDYGVELVVDASGIADNVMSAKQLLGDGILKVVVTHSPQNGIDHTLIIGANEETYRKGIHHVVSTSICDATACAPILKILEANYDIEDGFITTLHPWLGYQNLVDGSLRSVSNPGHFWEDFALGRASTENLIPKSTTLMPAVERVLPGISEKVHAISFRVPTSVVAASDMTLRLRSDVSEQELIDVFQRLEDKYPTTVTLNRESLVSVDFKGISQSLVIDLRWLKVYNNRSVKIVAWYDNEWGYANRVVDVVQQVVK